MKNHFCQKVPLMLHLLAPYATFIQWLCFHPCHIHIHVSPDRKMVWKDHCVLCSVVRRTAGGSKESHSFFPFSLSSLSFLLRQHYGRKFQILTKNYEASKARNMCKILFLVPSKKKKCHQTNFTIQFLKLYQKRPFFLVKDPICIYAERTKLFSPLWSMQPTNIPLTIQVLLELVLHR